MIIGAGLHGAVVLPNSNTKLCKM